MTAISTLITGAIGQVNKIEELQRAQVMIVSNRRSLNEGRLLAANLVATCRRRHVASSQVYQTSGTGH